MQTVKHNGIEYKTMNDLQEAFLKQTITHDEFTELWNQVRAITKENEVIEHFDFTDEQWESFDKTQRNMLFHSMEASLKIDDLQYQLDEFTYWADNMPSY